MYFFKDTYYGSGSGTMKMECEKVYYPSRQQEVAFHHLKELQEVLRTPPALGPPRADLE